MRLKLSPCSCGCKKYLVGPLFGCQCSSQGKETAEELVRRWNAFEPDQRLSPKDSPISENAYIASMLESIAIWLIANSMREPTDRHNQARIMREHADFLSQLKSKFPSEQK